MDKIDSPLGTVSAEFDGKQLCRLEIGKRVKAQKGQDAELGNRLRIELQHYFNNRDHRFSIPLRLQGTEFQKRVWSALCQIPVGTTLSYGQLAEQLHSSARAVGNACRANPVPIIVPCHRVVGKQGIGGYDGKPGGRRLAIKRWLLEHEGVHIN